MVGASANEGRPAYAIPSYLRSQGCQVVPVNPRGGGLFGERAYPSVREIDHPVDVVDVFRPPHEAEAVACDAITIGARVLWFEPGTETDEAARLAADAGLTGVIGRSMGATHGQLGLGPARPAPPR